MMRTLVLLATIIHLSLCQSDLANRLVGGEDADEGAAPYQASLRLRPSESHFCGGTIIDQYWIITAAHCLIETGPTNITVVVGTNSRSTGGDRYQGIQAIPHSGYQPERTKSTQHDIGLLRVSTPIQFSARANALPLADRALRVGTTLVITGWGRLWKNGPRPEFLQILFTRAISVAKCRSDFVNVTQVFDTQICTQTQEGEGACLGDSGGPVVGSGLLFGIVSWGLECAVGAPDVHTSVLAYRKWISENVLASNSLYGTPLPPGANRGGQRFKPILRPSTIYKTLRSHG